MPFTPDTAKPALLDERLKIQGFQATWVLIASLAGTGAALAIPALGAVTGSAAICFYVLQRNKLDVQRILDDPPRPDYEVPVRARRRRFEGGELRQPIERATAEFADTVLTRSAYLEATVRADERGQQALIVGDISEARTRRDEGRRAAERAAFASEDVSLATEHLLSAWTMSGELDALFRDARENRLATAGIRGEIDAEAVLAESTMEYVNRTGLVTGDLRPIVPVSAKDADDLISDPRRTIESRARKWAASGVRAAREVSEGFGREDTWAIDEPRERS